MGVKGDRAVKEPQAMRMYAEGHNLTQISAALDISDASLRKWKEESRVPGDEMDGWEKLRAQKRGNIQRLRDLFERQLEYVESLNPSEVTAAMMDTLSKLGSLVEKWDRAESVMRALTDAAEAVEEEAKAQGMDAKQAEFWRKKVLGVG